MTNRRHLIDGIQLLALTVWAAALIGAAIAAVNVFPTLRDMPLAMGAYPRVPAEDHWRYAAGEIMEGVFFLADLMQFIAVPVALLALGAQWARGAVRHPRIRLLRTALIALAALLFALHATTIAPPMNRLLRAQWSAAAEGDLDRVQEHRDAFQHLHVRADAILKINLLLVLAGIGLTPAATELRARPKP